MLLTATTTVSFRLKTDLDTIYVLGRYDEKLAKKMAVALAGRDDVIEINLEIAKDRAWR